MNIKKCREQLGVPHLTQRKGHAIGNDGKTRRANKGGGHGENNQNHLREIHGEPPTGGKIMGNPGNSAENYEQLIGSRMFKGVLTMFSNHFWDGLRMVLHQHIIAVIPPSFQECR